VLRPLRTTRATGLKEVAKSELQFPASVPLIGVLAWGIAWAHDSAPGEKAKKGRKR